MPTVYKANILILYILMFFSSCNKKENNLIVKVDSPLIAKNIKINMEVLASIPMTVVYDGKELQAIPNGYGENEWYFIYKDTLKGYLRHIKLNRNDKHIYKFTFYKQDEKYFIKADIEGDSPLRQVIELKKK